MADIVEMDDRPGMRGYELGHQHEGEYSPGQYTTVAGLAGLAESDYEPTGPKFYGSQTTGIHGLGGGGTEPTGPKYFGGGTTGLADPIMMLEGLSGDAASMLRAAGRTTMRDHASEARGVAADLVKHRKAAQDTRGERNKLVARVARYDHDIVDVLQPQLHAALQRGEKLLAASLEAKIKTYELARETAAGRALRFAKTEALAQVLARNARTRLHLVALAAGAKNPAHAQTLVAAADQLRDHSNEVLGIRARQVDSWRQQTAATKVALGQAVVRQSKVRLQAIARLPATSTTAAMAAREKATIVATMAAVKTAAAAAPQAMRDGEDGAEDLFGGDPMDTSDLEQSGMAAAALGELAGLSWGDIGGAFKDVGNGIVKGLKVTGNAITSSAKKVGKALKAGIEKAGKAALALIKKGACALAKNPAVLSAAASAAGTFVAPGAGTAAGGAAGGMVSKLLGGACPSQKADADPANMGAPDDASTTAPKKSVIPYVAAAGGAGVLLLLLL